ncbi:MAG: hypothetical protein EA442_05515 [Candidatus Nitrosopelagicus sp.]|nr:MAG: hypothetical protein EA442_05515 [Candidatus Nitrosopelagicus sp.]
MARLIGNHPKRSLESKVIKHFKVWQKHDISAFTGTVKQENGTKIYTFVKSDGTRIEDSSLDMLLFALKETNDINKDTTEDALAAFPLVKFDSLEHAKSEIDFRFSDDEMSKIKSISWNLEDQHSLSYTVTFDTVEDEWYFLESEKKRASHVVMDNSRARYDWP